MVAHAKMHSVVHFTPEHFERWIKLFTTTVDELFEGDKAELAKQRALSIATVMQLKIIYGEPSIPVIRREP
jgi:hemoglobin